MRHPTDRLPGHTRRIQSGSQPTAWQRWRFHGSNCIGVPGGRYTLGHPMSREALVSSRHTPVSPRNLKRRRMSAAAALASGKDAR